MKKVLRIQILSSPSRVTDLYTFKIVEQSHRNSDFGDGVPYFQASNGMELSSSGHPEIGYRTFYVRGTSRREDEKVLSCTSENFAQIQNAIQEYNLYYGGKEKNIGQDDYLRRMGIG